MDQPLALVVLIIGLTALGLRLESRWRWAQRLGASLLIILMGAMLGNLGLVPAVSPVYDIFTGPLTSLAIVWLLLAVDLRQLRSAGPQMLAAFAAAATGTVVGALVSAAIFARAFDQVWKLAGVLTGTYCGGSLNFVAVGREVGLGGSLYVAAAAADNVTTTLWMLICIAVPAWLTGSRAEDGHGPTTRDRGGPWSLQLSRLRYGHLAVLILLGFLVLVSTDWLAPYVPGVPRIILLTTIALALAHLPAVRRLDGALVLGTVALNGFFAVMGISSRIWEILRVGPEVFFMTASVVAIHGLVLVGAARLLGIDLPIVAVASQAAIGGPSTAMALAASQGWRELVLPGIVVGLLGYALGNYLGLVVAWLVRAWL